MYHYFQNNLTVTSPHARCHARMATSPCWRLRLKTQGYNYQRTYWNGVWRKAGKAKTTATTTKQEKIHREWSPLWMLHWRKESKNYRFCFVCLSHTFLLFILGVQAYVAQRRRRKKQTGQTHRAQFPPCVNRKAVFLASPWKEFSPRSQFWWPKNQFYIWMK